MHIRSSFHAARGQAGVTTGALLTLAGMAFISCSRAPMPGEDEEVHREVADVPLTVRESAASLCARLGDVRVVEWFWDREDRCWEATLAGLPRRAELDLLPDGTFDEL